MTPLAKSLMAAAVLIASFFQGFDGDWYARITSGIIIAAVSVLFSYFVGAAAAKRKIDKESGRQEEIMRSTVQAVAEMRQDVKKLSRAVARIEGHLGIGG